jgi:DNA-binding transcriptional regulator YhcF (GntR family)
MYETFRKVKTTMAIEEVKMFKTKDGKTFEIESDAVNHEEEVIIKEKLEEFVDKYFYSGISKFDITDILYENLDELIKIFKGK